MTNLLHRILLISIISIGVEAVELDEVTMIDLTYTRSFHDQIQITIVRYSNTNVQINTIVTPLTDYGLDYSSSKITNQDISEDKLIPILQFINNDDIRQLFKTEERRMIVDGSSIKLEISQNGYSESITGTSIFTEDVTNREKELANIARYIFNLGKVKIEDDELY